MVAEESCQLKGEENRRGRILSLDRATLADEVDNMTQRDLFKLIAQVATQHGESKTCHACQAKGNDGGLPRLM